mmetsp:Transcript_17708/g.39265  ORF Transcript_17708/g.39265 Transcript_17708/m.39265 type:complete len:590 (-) Transcript_17708:154-1923(-)
MFKLGALLIAIACLAVAFGFNSRATLLSRTAFQRWSKIQSADATQMFSRPFALKMSTETTVEEPTASVATPAAPAKDFSSYAVGQEYEGKAVSAKQFGVFVDIATGTSVLLPRSTLSKSSYEKLKSMAEAKSADLVKVELTTVSVANQTLSGKYMAGVADSYSKDRPDLDMLAGQDFTGKTFEATVVSAHDFGIFAMLEEFGVQGLVPASRLPLTEATIQKSYTAGQKVQVNIAEVDVVAKKLVLNMKSGRADVSAFATMSPETWVQGVIESVTSFGFFVRPAGFDVDGLVHFSRTPRDLLAALKRKGPMETGSNKTDIEMLFSKGDVVKVRVHACNLESRRVELSMLPYKAGEGDEDDYVVEGRDPEPEEGKRNFDQEEEEEEDSDYDAEDTLLWWRGAPYVKSSLSAEAVDEEIDVLNESKDIVEGTWRRMFEIDLREDQADFSSKAVEMDLKELAEEIGELDGLDDELLEADRFATSSPSSKARFGSFVSAAILPAGWRDEMDFFKQLDSAEGEISTKLRGGKAAEQAEFESLLKEVEVELEQASRRGPRVVPVDPVIAVAEAAEVAEVAVAVAVPVVEEAPAEGA